MHNAYANPYNQSEHPVDYSMWEYVVAGNDSLRNDDIPWLDESLLFNDDKCPRRDAPKEFVKKVLRFMNEDTFFDHIEYSI